MSRFYFLEQLDPQHDYKDGSIVSLTPAVSYALEKRGIPFHILRRNEEDLQMRGNDDVFFLKQINWVKNLDQKIQQEAPLLKANGIRAAYHHFSKLKFVMDTLMVYAIEAKQFLERHKVQSLVFVGKGEEDFSGPSIFDLRKNGHQAYLEILKIVCRELNIKFEIRAVTASNAPKPASGSLLNQLKPVLKALGLKQWFHFFKYAKWKSSAKPAQTSTASGVLFLDAGSEKIDHVLKTYVNTGMRIFTLIGRDIFEYSSLNETRAASLDTPRSGIPDLSQAAQKIAGDKSLYTIFQEKLTWDISSVFAPYLRHFIKEIIPAVISDYLNLKDFCSEHKIELMVAQGSSGKQYTAALNLAKNSKTIKSVCFQHSCGPTYWRDWIYGELDYFHHFMTTDTLHDSFFKKMSEEPWIDECQVRESSFYLKKLNASAVPAKAKTILYIPRKQSMRISKFNSYLYPLTWLYEIQKAVLDMFGKYPDIPVIYKHHPSSKWAEESILKYLEGKGYKNISVQQGSLKTFFEKSERVFMDYPSTPLFEAAASKLPVLALYPSADRIIPEMGLFFGESLKAFSTAKEAAEAVETFIQAQPETYRREIPFAQEDALETLTQEMLAAV